MAFTDTFEEAILNMVFRNIPFTPPESVYIGLFTSPASDASPGTEVVGGGYVRQQVTFSAPVQEDDKAVIRNSSIVEFPVATEDWGVISHIGLFDAETGGTMIAHEALRDGAGNPVTTEILTNDQLVIDVGNLTISLS